MLPRGPQHHPPDVEGRHEAGHHRLGHQLQPRGDARVELARRERRCLGGLGLQVEEHAQEFRARHAVDGAVVHLGDQRDLPVLEPLDDPHLPQWPVAVELAADDVGREVAQFAHAAGCREGGAPQVVVDVELGVVHPDRVAEAHRDLDEAALENRGQRDPVADQLADPPERVPAGHGGGVEDRCHGHVHVQGRRLHVEETRIEPGQPFGGHRSPWSALSLHNLAPTPDGGKRGTDSDKGGPAPPARSGENGGVPYAFLTVTLIGAAAVALAYRPIRREPFTVVSFAFAWIAGELAFQNIVWQMVATALFISFGAARRLGGVARARRRHRRLGRPPRARYCGAPGRRRQHRRPRRGAHRCLPGSDRADGADVGPLVARHPRHPAQVAGGAGDLQHRLLGRRPRAPQVGHLPLTPHPDREGARHGVHPRRRLGHRRQAGAGQADDVRAGRPGLGLRGHQLPVEPEGHLAGSHRRRKTGGGVGQGAHRGVRRRSLFRRGQRGVGRRPSLPRCSLSARGTPRSNRTSRVRTPPCRRACPSTASWT